MTSQARIPEHMALQRMLTQELQSNEQVCWFAYPDATKRVRQTSARLLSSWILLRFVILGALLIVLFLNSLVQSDSASPLNYGSLFLLMLLFVIAFVFLRWRAAQKRLQNTLYAITNRRLIMLTLDRRQVVQNSYYSSDLGQIDLIEREDAWGDIVIGGQQRLQSSGFSLPVASPRLSGIARVREAASLLTQLKSEHPVVAPQ